MHCPEGHKGRILVVDDEQNIRTVLSRFITKNIGYEVHTAEDGIEALRKLDEHTYHLVLTDLQMPNCDGFTLVQTITERFAHIPVIIISGSNTDEDLGFARRHGAADFLTKPVNFHALQQSMNRALGSA